jgi:hypothetical protein
VPVCARCGREVDDVVVERAGGDVAIHFLCHGHVDVLDIPAALVVAMRPPGGDVQIERAFVGGIGKPVDAATVDAVSRTA